MPLIRCPKCGQAYDVPGVVAVRLPNSIATCHCGEWIAGSKAAVLARLMNPEEIKEVDLQPYRIDAAAAAVVETPPQQQAISSKPRSLRVTARSGAQSIDTVFTIHEHPLWIGRQGCHVELEEAELSLRHCSISVRGEQFVVRDADSHMGTFLDGAPVEETAIDDGVHLLRVGTALVSIEPTEERGVLVGPIGAATDEQRTAQRLQARARAAAAAAASAAARAVLVCVAGPLNGQEFEIPGSGLIVGREGHVRVPDEFLSRKHFEVIRDEEGIVRVRDLGSRNGTFLNTLPARNTKVQPGDEIEAGVNRFRIEER
ncbi:MAG TPA: FHA domain-containing protein [Thermoanaerobaculia bacterium]|jgi:pSer/pThr/pTyr-binding forkhead associated (FHA) protein